MTSPSELSFSRRIVGAIGLGVILVLIGALIGRALAADNSSTPAVSSATGTPGATATGQATAAATSTQTLANGSALAIEIA
jgi:hypothetical protein